MMKEAVLDVKDIIHRLPSVTQEIRQEFWLAHELVVEVGHVKFGLSTTERGI